MRAGSRQVIDVVAIVIENAFRPANGRLAGLGSAAPFKSSDFNDSPQTKPARRHRRIWAFCREVRSVRRPPLTISGVVTGTADGVGTVVSLVPDVSNQQCDDLIQPFLWTKQGGIQALGTVADYLFSGASCYIPFYGTATNNSAQTVGYTSDFASYEWGFLRTHDAPVMKWFGGTWPPTIVNGISGTGQIVGQNSNNSVFLGHATWWRNGVNLTTYSDSGFDLGTL